MLLDDEETLEILSPNPEMAALIGDLKKTMMRFPDPGASTAVPVLWEELPLEAFVREVARLPLMLTGWSKGDIPDSNLSTGEILHDLSAELDIMSGEDLNEAFLMDVEGEGLAADYRRVLEARSVSLLWKNSAVMGWSGFEVETQNQALQEALKRKRVFADAFRGEISWMTLRCYDLLKGAALIEKAIAGEMISVEDAGHFKKRIGGELLLRYSSWESLARAIQIAAVWIGLEESVHAAEDALRQMTTVLESLLSEGGAWRQFPWPQQKADESLPEVY